MTKRTRTVLFLFLAVTFLFAAPSLILYSQGYGVDWKSKRIVQTGALYVKILPTKTDILVDGKILKTTDFFFGSALVGNLFPGSRHVQVFKHGYQPWTKHLEIKEKWVTDAKNIILFPEDPEFSIAADRVQRIWKTPKENTLLLQKNTQEKIWKLVLFRRETMAEQTIFTSKGKEEIWDIRWSLDGTRILLSLASGESMRFLVFSLQKDQPCGSSPCSLDFLGESINTVLFSPASKDRVVFTKFLRNALVLTEADYIQEKVLSPFGSNVITFTLEESTLSWLENNGRIWKKDMGSENPAQIISSLSYPAIQETEYSMYVVGDVLFLKEGTRLLQVDSQKKSVKEVFSQTHIIVGSPDSKKLAVSNGSEAWILYLQGSQDQPIHTAGDKVFLTRLSKNIDNLSWINSHYLVFSADTAIQTIEVDDRDAVNTAEVAQFPDPKLFWQEASKVLAVLSQGNVYISEKLIK